MTTARVQVPTDAHETSQVSTAATYRGMTADEVAALAARKLTQAEDIAREATQPGWHLTTPPRPIATAPYCPPSRCYCRDGA